MAAVAFPLLALVLLLLLPPPAAPVPASPSPPPPSASQGRGFFSSLLSYLQSFFTFTGVGGGSGSSSGADSGGRDGRKDGARVSYRGWELLRAAPRDEDEADELLEMLRELEEEGSVQLWAAPLGNRSADFAVAPDLKGDVKDFLAERDILHFVLVSDLQKAISAQNPRMSKEERMELRQSRGHDFTFKRYHRYSDILRYLGYLATTYPRLVEILTIGHSSEGLPLKLAKVSTGGGITKDGKPKPAVWIDGGSHGREWISPAVALFALRQLVENYAVNRRLVDAAEWYVLPVANPDGYEFSHTTDRLWRKTRSRHGDSGARFFLDRDCVGVDLSRNWGFHWGPSDDEDPCSQAFSGPKAFSEPESRAMADFVTDHADRLKLFVSLHSYAQMLLVPWGYTRKPPMDMEDLMQVGVAAVDAVARVGGVRYDVGHAPQLMYASSGTADDWAKGVAGIKYSYTMELRDRGDFGFLLPANQIVPTGKEAFTAIKTMVKMIAAKTPTNRSVSSS